MAHESTQHTSGELSHSIVYLDSFEVPLAMSAEKKEAYKRRFLTLFLSDTQKGDRGGLGCVYKVLNAKGEVFALKRLVLPEKHPLDEDERYERFVKGQIDSFRKEYESQQRLLGLKGFPKLYGYGYTENDPIILMEWVDGMTLDKARSELASCTQTNQLSPLLVAQLGMQVFDLFARMNYLDEGFIHRDISLNNIMIRLSERSLEEQVQEGEFDLCLIDFGSASTVIEDGPSFTTINSLLRNATPEYAPPEMLSTDFPDLEEVRKSPKIDIYALGSVLYTLAAGHTPYSLSSQKLIGSYFRYKIEHDVPAIATLHARPSWEGHCNEPQVQQFMHDFAAREGAYFDARRFTESLLTVDAQLNAIIQQCLRDEQERRPDAEAAYTMLKTFEENYFINLDRKYRGEPLLPFSTGNATKRNHHVELRDLREVTVLLPGRTGSGQAYPGGAQAVHNVAGTPLAGAAQHYGAAATSLGTAHAAPAANTNSAASAAYGGPANANASGAAYGGSANANAAYAAGDVPLSGVPVMRSPYTETPPATPVSGEETKARRQLSALKTSLLVSVTALVVVVVALVFAFLFDGTLFSIGGAQAATAGALPGWSIALALAAPPLLVLPSFFLRFRSSINFLVSSVLLVFLQSVSVWLIMYIDWGSVFAGSCLALAVIITSAVMLIALACNYGRTDS